MTEPIIGFAHRGAPQNRQQQNTLPAFQRALAMGASGLETDVALTADGVPVLLHTGISLGRGRMIRSRDLQVSRVRREQLPATIPSLADLYEQCGTDFHLSLDMAEPRAAEAVVSVARHFDALERLWLTYWRLPTLRLWRERWSDIHLIYPTIRLLPGRSDRLIERLAELQVDALNLYHRIYPAHVVAQARYHNMLVFAWGLKNEHALHRILRRGVDGVFCDDLDAMVRLVPRPT